MYLANTNGIKTIPISHPMQILPDDGISTSVCTECCEHLEDFNGFWQLVEQKQCSLKKEFLTVDVDCAAMKWTGGVDVDVNIDELPLAAGDMDEKPLDLHNLSLLGSVLDVNVDSVEVREPIKEQLPCEEEEDEKPCLQASDSEPEVTEGQPESESDSSDGYYLNVSQGLAVTKFLFHCR